MNATDRASRRSLPDGVTVALSRARVRAGAAEEATRWMDMLDDRLEESVATLDRERMAIEIIFRLRDGDEDYLYWVTVHGKAGASVTDSDHALDVDHLAFDQRVRDGSWVRAEPQVLLLPNPVRAQVLAWTDHGSQPVTPSPGPEPVATAAFEGVGPRQSGQRDETR